MRVALLRIRTAREMRVALLRIKTLDKAAEKRVGDALPLAIECGYN